MPSQGEKICADEASSSGNVLKSAICGAVARRNNANAEKFARADLHRKRHPVADGMA
ncbi:MAG TPA: hypothetical protein VKA43_07725 [Gammaproteobacteria bacterium]|nr:hypothetical protein [Gammaproteobacteria bacterium]